MSESIDLNFEKILLEDPLFTSYPLKRADYESYINLLLFNPETDKYSQLKTIDSYCTSCQKETTFNSEISNHDDIMQVQRMIMSFLLTQRR